MGRNIVDAVAGIFVAAVIYLGLANLPPQLTWYVIPFSNLVGGLDGISVIIVVVMLAAGAWWRRPGIAAAPFLFAAIWLSAAIAQRVVITSREDPALTVRVVPTELRGVRTLITASSLTQRCCGQLTLLAGGIIDRYVHVVLDYQDKVVRITSYRLARGADCTRQDRLFSALLIKAGRADECIHAEPIADIPDGVVVRMHTTPQAYAALACCNTGTISLRRDGTETVKATWHYGGRKVISFLPVFGAGDVGDAVPLWRVGSGGPEHRIEIGGRFFRHEDLAAAVYGINWDAPVKPVAVSGPALVRRAAAVARLPTWAERLPALDVALKAQREGFVDDELIDVVTSFVHGVVRIGSYGSGPSIYSFWGGLDDVQKRTFVERVLARVQDPAEGTDFNEGGLELTLPPAKFLDVAARAREIFAIRHDLKLWQYELALRLARPAWRPTLDTLRDDNGASFPLRALAWKRLYPGVSEEERGLFAQRIDLVPERFRREYSMMIRAPKQ